MTKAKAKVVTMSNNIPENIPKKFFKFTVFFIKPHKYYVCFYLIIAILAGCYPAINSYLMKIIIDIFAADHFLISNIVWPALLLILSFELYNLSGRVIEYISIKVLPVIKNDITSKLFFYVTNHSYKYLQNNLSGKISNNINNVAECFEHAAFYGPSQLIRGGIQFIVNSSALYIVHPLFAISLLIWGVIFFAISIIFMKKIEKLADNYAESCSLANGKLVDSISNTFNSKIYAREKFELSYLQKYLNNVANKFCKKEGLFLKVTLAQGLTITILFAITIYNLIVLRSKNLISPGDFALVFGLVYSVSESAWWIIDHIMHIISFVGKANHSLGVLLTNIEIKDKPNCKPLVIKNGEICFKNVKFQHCTENLLFNDKSIHIRGGQRVGLVGYSGSGKSTFANLILRLFDIHHGEILIDGYNIKNISQKSLRDAISFIPQEPILFHRSIMENIRYGNLEASDDDVINITKLINAHEFIIKLKNGYNSIVGERGIKLSGGQRQRIAIARALLKNAPILIMDEATSSLDSLTEINIQRVIWKYINNDNDIIFNTTNNCQNYNLKQKKTFIIIAHRLSTLLHLDRIIVFNNGKIIEDGTHNQLLELNGLYKAMWDTQINGCLPNTLNMKASEKMEVLKG